MPNISSRYSTNFAAFAKGGRDLGCPDEYERILRSMREREREL
jgi:hypothetical protein